MTLKTAIEWCDATINFWWGCTKVSPGCANCYAESLSTRFGRAKWGKGEARVPRLEAALAEARKLQKQARREGIRKRAFVNSMSDVFDAEVPDEWRDEVIAAAIDSPHVDFLLLTKRIENAASYLRARNVRLPNVWLGVTAENQEMADRRIPLLLETPAAVRWVSYEPALGPVDFDRTGYLWSGRSDADREVDGLDWIVVGGESGPGARPFDGLEWDDFVKAGPSPDGRTSGPRSSACASGRARRRRPPDERPRLPRLPRARHGTAPLRAADRLHRRRDRARPDRRRGPRGVGGGHPTDRGGDGVLDRAGGERSVTNLVDKTCASIDFFTPERILERVRHYFGLLGGDGIDLDPATTEANPTKAARFFTKADDGLAQMWGGALRPVHIFVNPPYGKDIRGWVAKIGTEADLGHRVVALLPGQRFEQAYWQRSLFRPELTALVAVRSRVSFLRADGTPAKGNPYGSFLYVFNGKWMAAVEAFAPIGMVLETGRVVQHAPG